VSIAAAALALTLMLNVVTFQLSRLPQASFFALLALAASFYLLIEPGLRLFQTRDRSAAMRLFNRASYYPAAMLLVVLVGLSI
jgi:4-hydroxybenzoate polyprenyltransferase